jgi:glycosyltransferase involved in cell wall biosynthesis
VKALFIASAYPRGPGDVITPWLTETIHRLSSRGIQVEVLAPAYRGNPSTTLDGVVVHRFRYAPRRWETLTHDQTAPDRIRDRPHFAALVPGYVTAGSLAAARLTRGGDFDLVHAFWPLPHGVLGMAAARAGRIPLVTTFFGVELTWTRRQLPFLSPLLRRVVRASAAVTAISSYTAGMVRELSPTTEPVLIPFGGAVEPPPEAPPVGREREAPLRLLFVGRLVERKGVHVLLRALARPEAHLAELEVVGDGPSRQELEELAAQLGLGARVRFRGTIPDAGLRGALRECHALVLPAVTDAKGDTEGLGVVLIEALTFARPVIASEAGGIVDIVSDGRNGLLVPPGDDAALAGAIAQLANDPGLAAEMGRNGRDDMRRHFSWEVIIDRLEALYSAVRGGRS